jgi:hypothetical protein
MVGSLAAAGQRVAAAFVATPDRRACAAQLGQSRRSYHVNAAGLHAKNAGDLATAREYPSLGVRYFRIAEDRLSLPGSED